MTRRTAFVVAMVASTMGPTFSVLLADASAEPPPKPTIKEMEAVLPQVVNIEHAEDEIAYVAAAKGRAMVGKTDRVEFLSASVLRYGVYNPDGRYWPVELCVVVRVPYPSILISFARAAGRDHSPAVLGARMLFRFSRDDFEGWQPDVVRRTGTVNSDDVTCQVPPTLTDRSAAPGPASRVSAPAATSTSSNDSRQATPLPKLPTSPALPSEPARQTAIVSATAFLGKWVATDPKALIKCIDVVSNSGFTVHFNNCGRGGATFSLPATVSGSLLIIKNKTPGRDDEITCDLREDDTLKMLYTIKVHSGKESMIPIGFQRDVASAASVRQSAPPPAASTAPVALGNAEVLDLLKAGLGPDLVVAKIRQSKTAFDTSPTALKALKEAKVPDAVILAMIEAK
jgi:hypothetical protein